jgi:hypothetical protein
MTDHPQVHHQIAWFDIPVLDLDRAIRFYAAVLGQPVHKESFPNGGIGVLAHGEGSVGGCLTTCENGAKPSGNGPLLYFNCNGRLDQAIDQVVPQGGQVLKGKHQIGPYGSRALILDSEGNRVALHST